MKDEQRKVPKIRFKGFTDAWEQRRLEEQVNFFNGLTYKPADVQGEGVLVIRSSNIQEGRFIDADNVYVNREVVNVDTIRKGDIVVVVRNGSRKLIGKHAILKNDMPNAVIGAFMTGIRTSNSRFINALLSTKKFEKEVEMNMGATINQITGYMFAKMEFRFPSNDEASKVGMVFEQIDNLITLHQRKVDKLKDMKKTLLQKMFPKNNQTVPDIRFQGFTDAWEQRKLSSISEIVTGTTPPTKDKDNYNGNKLFISPADIQGNRYIDKTITTLTSKGFALGRELRPGSSLFVSIGSTIGKVAQIKDFATTNQQINAVIPNDNMDDDFIFTLLEQKSESIRKISAQQAVPIVNKTTFGNVEVTCTFKEEQKYVGTFFKEIDNLITLHHREE